MSGEVELAQSLVLGALDGLRTSMSREHEHALAHLVEHLRAETVVWCDEGHQAADEAKPFDGVTIRDGEMGFRLVTRLGAWLRHKAIKAGVEIERTAIRVRRWDGRDFLVFRGDDS